MPCAVGDESVGASEPQHVVCAAEYEMQTVAVARTCDVAERSVGVEWTLLYLGHALVGASPEVAPAVAEHRPHYVVGYGASRARVVQSMAHGICYLVIYEHSVVCACIYVVAVQCKRLDGVASERRYGP